MFLGYKKASTKSEMIVDIGVPLVFAIAIGFLLIKIDFTFIDAIKNLIVVNNTALTFLSILAGFSVASISVLATSNSDVIRRLREAESNQLPGEKKFNVMMIFFCSSIVLQFFSIFLSLLSIIILPVIDIKEDKLAEWFIIVPLCIWYFVLMFTISVSIRNVKVLYYVLVSDN